MKKFITMILIAATFPAFSYTLPLRKIVAGTDWVVISGNTTGIKSEPMYYRASCAVGGNWPTYPTPVFPDTLLMRIQANRGIVIAKIRKLNSNDSFVSVLDQANIPGYSRVITSNFTPGNVTYEIFVDSFIGAGVLPFYITFKCYSAGQAQPALINVTYN